MTSRLWKHRSSVQVRTDFLYPLWSRGDTTVLGGSLKSGFLHKRVSHTSRWWGEGDCDVKLELMPKRRPVWAWLELYLNFIKNRS